MTKQPLTREDVERAVREALGWKADVLRLPEKVSAMALTMAECSSCRGTGQSYPGWMRRLTTCPRCHGTGLDQSRAARGLNALEGR